jgi:hypothetical protein
MGYGNTKTPGNTTPRATQYQLFTAGPCDKLGAVQSLREWIENSMYDFY